MNLTKSELKKLFDWGDVLNPTKWSAFIDDLLNRFNSKEYRFIPGGTKGQILTKKSDIDYDVEWIDAPLGGGLNSTEYQYITSINAPFDAQDILVAPLSKYSECIIQIRRDTAYAESTGWVRPIIANINTGSVAVFSYFMTSKERQHMIRIIQGDNMYFAEQWLTDDEAQQKANTVERTSIWNKETLIKNLDDDFENHYFGVRIPSSTVDGTEVIEIWGKPKYSSSNGGQDAVLYNEEQFLTDQQKNQVAKNLGQPRERLILDWSNDGVEVLQPTAYDAATGYFTTDKMPSWLAEDGNVTNAVINYTDAILLGTASSKNVMQGTYSGSSVINIKRISETQFLCTMDETGLTPATVPATVDVSLFYFTSTIYPAFQLLKEGEVSPTEGIKKFHIHITDCVGRESKYVRFWLNGRIEEYLLGELNYPKFNAGSIGHFTQRCFGITADMEVWVDYGAEREPKGKFVRIDSSGSYFNLSNANLEYYVNPTMSSNWGDIRGYSVSKQCYFRCRALGSRATVRITEIID